MSNNENKGKTAQGAAPKDAKVKNINVTPANGQHLPALIQKKPLLNLDETIKAVSDLHMKVRHRDRLEEYADQLQKFEIRNRDEDLDDKTSYYTGCKLELRDDRSTIFTLKHPVLISQVIDYLKTQFRAKVVELEAAIVLPQ